MIEEPQSTAVALAPKREIRVNESDNPVMSTAGLEHMVRIARIMVDSQTMPESITHTGKGQNKVALDDRIVLARAFMIVEQATGWKRSPFALQSHASFVHGKICWEGKVINAILSDDYGIDLTYEFGTWVAAEERCDLTKGEGAGDLLAVRVSGMVNGRMQYIDGSVGIWKTTGDGSPWRPGAMRRQCRYRGAREFVRAYRPGVIIGVLADDEVEDFDRTPQRLSGPAPTLADAHGEPEPAQVAQSAPRGRGRPPKAAAEVTHTLATVHPSPEPEAEQTGPQAHGTGSAEPVDDGSMAAAATDVSEDITETENGSPGTGGDIGQTADNALDAEFEEVDESQDDGVETRAYEAALTAATGYHDARSALITFKKTPTYAEYDENGRKRAQLQTLTRLEELRGQGMTVPTPEAEPWMFSLWLNGAARDQVMPTFLKLMRSPAYAALNEAQREGLAAGVDRATGELI